MIRKDKTRPPGAKWWYSGILNPTNMEELPKRAYRSWTDQRHRCSNPKLDCYKYYGAKGIQVKYSAREFVGWWLEEFKEFKGKKPTISRINHDGHYEFGNIKLEDHMDNCVWDTLKRHGAPGSKSGVPVLIFSITHLKPSRFNPILICGSAQEAAQITRVKSATINAACSRRTFPKKGKPYLFRYLSDFPEYEASIK